MSDKWAVDIVAALGGGSGKKDIAPSGSLSGDTAIAAVVSTVPLSISLSGVVISKNLYMNPALLLEAQQPDKIGAMFTDAIDILSKCPEIEPGPVELFTFLKAYHEAAVIRAGDTVVVKQFGVSYYVMEKVVPAS